MKEKRDCRVVQDLLPNYIEELTNEETNRYIEEHLKKCEECKKVSENMKNDFKLNCTKRDNREVKYIKKFNTEMKALKFILLLIVIVFTITVGRNIIILTDLSNKSQQIVDDNKQNYYIKVESYSEGNMQIIEGYYKDEKTLVNIEKYSKNSEKLTQILYKNGDEKVCLIDNGKTKTITEMGDIVLKPVSFTSDIFVVNLYTSLFTKVEKIKLNEIECYIVKDGNTEKFIDAKTGLAIKQIDNANNRTIDYYYEFGNVDDKDIVKPDIN